MIGLFLIVQVPDAGNERGVAFTSGPIDCFLLGSEGAEDVIRVILDDEIVDGTSLGTAFGTRFDVYVRHAFLSCMLPGSIADMLFCTINGF
jgi:hypothetical protein